MYCLDIFSSAPRSGRWNGRYRARTNISSVHTTKSFSKNHFPIRCVGRDPQASISRQDEHLIRAYHQVIFINHFQIGSIRNSNDNKAILVVTLGRSKTSGIRTSCARIPQIDVASRTAHVRSSPSELNTRGRAYPIHSLQAQKPTYRSSFVWTESSVPSNQAS